MTRQIATFVLGQTRLGLDILLVKEINRNVSITPVPDAPKQVRGLMNLRGRVVTVMDLDACLNRDTTDQKSAKYLLILKTDTEIKKYQQAGLLPHVSLGDDIAGFIIDQMADVVDMDDADILPAPPNLENIEKEMVEGIIKKDETLIILLDITAILGRVMTVMENTAQE